MSQRSKARRHELLDIHAEDDVLKATVKSASSGNEYEPWLTRDARWGCTCPHANSPADTLCSHALALAQIPSLDWVRWLARAEKPNR